VSYFEGGSLRITDLASQKALAEYRVPFMSWGVTAWSPAGDEICLGSSNPERESLGLWLYDLRTQEFLKVLDGQITNASWSPMGTELACCLGPPYYDIWTVPMNPTIRPIEALGPGRTSDEHFCEMLAFYTRRIEADPSDAYAYSGRAHYYDSIGDKKNARADMRRWSAVMRGGTSSCITLAASRKLRRVIKLPFDCEFVLSTERPVNTTPMMSVAFGQKGRCEMRLFQIPVFIASLLGFCVVSGLDSPPAHADFTFGEPVNLESEIQVLDPVRDTVECFSPDGLEMYIGSDSRSGGYGAWDMWVSRRASKDQNWGLPENLGTVFNTAKDEGCGSISSDGLTLYFYSDDRPGGYGSGDIYVATRATKNDPWDMAVNLGPGINSSKDEKCPVVSPSGLELYFTSYLRSGGYGGNDIYVARRATIDDSWGEPENLGPVVNSPYQEWNLRLSPDGLLLLFSDQFAFRDMLRPGGYGGCDIWMTRRAALSDLWQTPVNLGRRVNGPGGEFVPCVSPDGSMFYFNSDRGGDYNNYKAPIIPIVDFTGDGQVDGKDLLVMVMELGGNDSLCDIGPYAWGDGVVDAKDLTVLAEYIGQGFQDPTLVAHWAFDETEGDIATDSMDESDGRVMIGATWRPHAGMVGGALELDGVTGSVVTGSVEELGTGPFSVVAWVKGGAPGQILLNHGGTTDWLMANPIDGSLMTKLTSNGQPLSIGTSETVITDGKWHRIALVFDGADRILYADGKEVARDPQPDLTVSDGKFIIGAGSKTGTGWSGLIDDVRIYNRVVRP
jgi:Tol biopolymer transport system component